MKKHKRSLQETAARRPDRQSYQCEAEVIEGLEDIASRELQALHGRVRGASIARRPGAIAFEYQGDLRLLERLKMTQAVYVVQRFRIPRPKALLGDMNFRVVITTIQSVLQATPQAHQHFKTLHVSAAGADSPIMRRIADTIAAATGLMPMPDEGDLWIRIRPTPGGGGWDILIRLTPRPLASRYWRVCNLEGALNATVAHAMAVLSEPEPDQRVLNVGSGSGSLLIERAAWGEAERLVGADHEAAAHACARANLEAAHVLSRVELLQTDIRRLPLRAESFDSVLADLPFGQRVGSHEDNLTLYPAVLSEAARVTRKGGTFVAITHEVRLMDRLLRHISGWSTEQILRITLRGLHPRIYVLRRTE